MPNLVTVEFRGDTVFAVEEADGVFVAVKPICQRFGLAWHGQFERIQRDPILAEGVRVIRIPSPGGAQDTTCLPLRLVNGWLFGIDVERVKPELREDVLAYKRECYETLADRFLGPRAGANPIRLPETGRDTEYRRRLDTVSEARRLYGPARARLLYERLGLPEVPELPPGGLEVDDAGEAVAPFDEAAVFALLRDHLRNNGPTGFVPAADAGDPATWGRRGVLGFRHANGDYLLPLPGWRGFLAGLDERAAARAMARAGWLVKDRENRHATVARIGGKPWRVYRIRAAFLVDA